MARRGTCVDVFFFFVSMKVVACAWLILLEFADLSEAIMSPWFGLGKLEKGVKFPLHDILFYLSSKAFCHIQTENNAQVSMQFFQQWKSEELWRVCPWLMQIIDAFKISSEFCPVELINIYSKK